MTDEELIERLRYQGDCPNWGDRGPCGECSGCLSSEAADELTRLKAVNEELVRKMVKIQSILRSNRTVERRLALIEETSRQALSQGAPND